MTKLTVFVITLAMSMSALFAQTLTGTWQGALKVPQAPNGELRIVMKLSISEKDTLKAEFIAVDQGGQPIAAESVKQSGSSIKIAIPALNGTYEGNVGADGTTMTG